MKRDNSIMPILVLLVIGLVTTFLLALTHELTKEARAAQEIARINENRRHLYPQAEEYLPISVGDWPKECPSIDEIYIALDSQGKELGMLFIASCRGYAGAVPVMVAVDINATITGLRVLDNEETPGLGKKIEEAGFLDQFLGRGLDKDFLVRHDAPDDQRIDAVSGATISSRAVADALNAIADIYPLIEQEAMK